LVTAVHPVTGVAIAVMVPAFAGVRPASSASAATLTVAGEPVLLVTSSVVTHAFDGSPETLAREPVGSVTPAFSVTDRVTVPFVAARRSIPGASSHRASSAAPDAPAGTRALYTLPTSSHSSPSFVASAAISGPKTDSADTSTSSPSAVRIVSSASWRSSSTVFGTQPVDPSPLTTHPPRSRSP